MTNSLPNDIMEKSSEQVKYQLSKQNFSDFMWSVGKVIFNMASGIMPVKYQIGANTLITIKENFGSTASEKLQLDFLIKLFERLKELEEKLDKNLLDRDNFELYVQRFLDNIKHEQYEAKSLAFRNALINIATNKINNNFEIEYFVNNLINFSDLHFAILSYFNKPEETLKEKSINLESLKSQSGGEDGIIQSMFDNLDFELVKIASRELKDKGFTTTQLPFGGGASSYNAYQKLTNNYLTPLGQRFISFCLDEN